MSCVLFFIMNSTWTFEGPHDFFQPINSRHLTRIIELIALMLALCEALCDKYTIAIISVHVFTFYFQIHQHFPKKVITMSNLKRTKGWRRVGNKKNLNILKCICHVLRRLWVVIKNSSTLKKIEKISHVVKGAYVPFVKTFPLGTTMVIKNY